MHENYFENIDTFEKAYWLGFLITDGSVKCNRVILSLSIKDEFIIDKFIEALNIPKERKRYYIHKLNGKEYSSVTISLISEKMVSDLKHFNVVQRKTFICIFPKLENRNLDLALLSGCFDGDGCGGSSVICSGNYAFLKQIKERFGIVYPICQKKNNVYVLSVGCALLKEAQNLICYIERKKIYGDFYNSRTKNKKSGLTKNTTYMKCLIWMEKNNLNILDFKVLIDTHGLAYVGKKFNCSGSKIKNICKHLNIPLPTLQERAFSMRKCTRPSKEELTKLLEKTSYVQVGKMFNVSDNAIRKWLK